MIGAIRYQVPRTSKTATTSINSTYTVQSTPNTAVLTEISTYFCVRTAALLTALSSLSVREH